MPKLVIGMLKHPSEDGPNEAHDEAGGEPPASDELSPEETDMGQAVMEAFRSRDAGEVYRAICDIVKNESGKGSEPDGDEGY